MKKYKLIKEYPGSPELGTEVEKSASSYFYRSGDKRICVFNEHVEDNPEYWEESCSYYLVYTEMRTIWKNWEPVEVEEKIFDMENVKYFETKEEAEEFIFHNKPCLSYNDIMWIFEENTKKNTISIDIDKLIEIIKQNKI